MAVAAPKRTAVDPGRSRLHTFLRSAAVLLLLTALGAGLLWWTGPLLLAPVDDFVQGPGGAVAYVSLSRQIHQQSAQFWTGGDVRIRLGQEEFSGMLSSALLTGRRPGDPIRRVRGSLVDGEIKVETVVHLPYASVPEQFRGPLGLRLRLNPEVTKSGVVQFRITRAFAGRIPVSPALLRLVGRMVPIKIPGYDASQAAVSLPLGDMITQSLGRQLQIKEFSARNGELNMTIAMAPEKMK